MSNGLNFAAFTIITANYATPSATPFVASVTLALPQKFQAMSPKFRLKQYEQNTKSRSALEGVQAIDKALKQQLLAAVSKIFYKTI